ncbi:MAG: hypothetical protein QOJ99_73 [Bryobacterales bacterium]|nr:hypothetical protein [Bryobacterales bacterium]
MPDTDRGNEVTGDIQDVKARAAWGRIHRDRRDFESHQDQKKRDYEPKLAHQRRRLKNVNPNRRHLRLARRAAMNPASAKAAREIQKAKAHNSIAKFQFGKLTFAFTVRRSTPSLLAASS